MIFHYREAHLRDMPEVLDIDIKSFDYPWSAEEWNHAGQNTVCIVATLYGSVIGFVVLSQNLGDRHIEILKLAVKGAYRLRGVASTLLSKAHEFARDVKSDSVHWVVPEHLCYPPHTLPDFMAKMSFTPVGIKRDAFTDCGAAQDGFRFVHTARKHYATTDRKTA